MSAAPTRRDALRALLAVGRGEDLEHSRSTRARRALPPGEDPGFLTELVKGALQWQARYDHLVTAFSRRQPHADPRVLAILRLSLHQLLAMGGVPAYAAIHQAGELCREADRARRRRLRERPAAGRAPRGRRRGRPPRAPAPALPRSRARARGLPRRLALPAALAGRALAARGTASPPARRLLAHANRPRRSACTCSRPHDPDAAPPRPWPRPGATTTRGPAPPARAGAGRARTTAPTCAGWLDAYPGLIVQDEGAQAATAWLAQDVVVAGCSTSAPRRAARRSTCASLLPAAGAGGRPRPAAAAAAPAAGDARAARRGRGCRAVAGDGVAAAAARRGVRGGAAGRPVQRDRRDPPPSRRAAGACNRR